MNKYKITELVSDYIEEAQLVNYIESDNLADSTIVKQVRLWLEIYADIQKRDIMTVRVDNDGFGPEGLPNKKVVIIMKKRRPVIIDNLVVSSRKLNTMIDGFENKLTVSWNSITKSLQIELPIY